MPDQDWTAGPYARVYADLADRFPEVWADDALLAWYVRLLVPADRAYPLALSWPMDIPGHVQADLVTNGAVDTRPGGRYQVHGMDRLQGARVDYHRAGGAARARAARRDHLGRMLGRDAGPAAGPVNGNAGPDAGPAAGDPAGHIQHSSPGETMLEVQHSSTDPNLVVGGDPSLQSGSPPTGTPVETRAPEGFTPQEPAAAYRYALAHFGPDNSPCSEEDPAWEHVVANHMFWHGVGWRCRAAEAEDPRTFRERMEAYSDRPF